MRAQIRRKRQLFTGAGLQEWNLGIRTQDAGEAGETGRLLRF
jgi:hypothetical protein